MVLGVVALILAFAVLLGLQLSHVGPAAYAAIYVTAAVFSVLFLVFGERLSGQ